MEFLVFFVLFLVFSLGLNIEVVFGVGFFEFIKWERF